MMFYLFAISPLNDILDLAILSLPSKSNKRILFCNLLPPASAIKTASFIICL
jgi:hypothetical protein